MMNMTEKDKKSLLTKQFNDNLEKALSDRMGHLYNRFVAYISESGLPLINVMCVLEIILSESIEMAKDKYKG